MSSRPAELQILLNPAFCAALLRAAIEGYREESGHGFPMVYCFLILPLALHQRTRNKLPVRLSTTLAMWTQRNPEVLVELAPRLVALNLFVREALIWGLASDIFSLEGASLTLRQPSPWTSRNYRRSDEVAACEKAARLLGRWFALSGSVATIFTLLGASI